MAHRNIKYLTFKSREGPKRFESRIIYPGPQDFEGFGYIYKSQPSYKLPPCASPNSTFNLLPHWHRVVFQRHCTARSDMELFYDGHERQICVSRATSNASSAIWNRALLKSFNSQWFVWPRFNQNTLIYGIPMCPHLARCFHGFLGKVLSL